MKKAAKSSKNKTARASRAGRAKAGGQDIWNLRLYVAGQSPKSIAALTNLKRICEQHLPGQYRIEVVDLMRNPQLAAGDQILAVPTLVRKLPEPVRKIVGDLSNTERALVGLQLRPWRPEDHGVGRETGIITRAI